MLNKKQKDKEYRQLYYDSQLMKIDVIQKRFDKSSERKFLNRQNKSKNCYTYDKFKHFSRKCIQNKHKNKLLLYDNHGRIIAITKIKFINNH